MSPILERVAVKNVEEALLMLTQAYQLPDMTEVYDARAMRIFRKQIEQGYFMRLVWPPGTTHEQALAWYAQAECVLQWHKLGVL